jgi:hypothetical protein
MLMLSCAANGQQDNKKIDELIFHYPICSARAEADLVAQPCRLARRFQRWGKAANLRMTFKGEVLQLQRPPCSPCFVPSWLSDR